MTNVRALNTDVAIQSFANSYGNAPELIIVSPGRAEILGNHTDYNQGFALACAISRAVTLAMRRRKDDLVRLKSQAFLGKEIDFKLEDLAPETPHTWGGYAKGVIDQLLKAGAAIKGADIFIASDLPLTGGLSSSAAYELAAAIGFKELYNLDFDRFQLAKLCQRAENGPFVGTPSGLLDQATIALAKESELLLFDFRGDAKSELAWRYIPTRFDKLGYTLALAIDFAVKRNLGETGYPARRAACERSLPFLTELLNKPVKALRDVTVGEFVKIRPQLVELGGETIAKRVEHVVYENQRVIDALSVLSNDDMAGLGKLFSDSGRSAIELYELAEGTPELISLLEIQRALPGVAGVRNMGGGFSALTLALIKQEQFSDYAAQLTASYKSRWDRIVEIIPFKPEEGVKARWC